MFVLLKSPGSFSLLAFQRSTPGSFTVEPQFISPVWCPATSSKQTLFHQTIHNSQNMPGFCTCCFGCDNVFPILSPFGITLLSTCNSNAISSMKSVRTITDSVHYSLPCDSTELITHLCFSIIYIAL